MALARPIKTEEEKPLGHCRGKMNIMYPIDEIRELQTLDQIA